MKKLLVFLLMMISSGLVQAETSILLTERTVTLPVEISKSTLKWSKADYAEPVVKVLVPALADVTILNHRNTNEGSPCLASYEATNPEQVIKDNPSVENIEFTIKLTKRIIPIIEKKTCYVFLIEDISSQIRSFNFIHSRTIQVGERHIDDCR